VSIVIAMHDELGLPMRFIGTGEKLDDFALFDGHEFIAKMI
jgi:signal recognition particle GTPase